MLDPNWAKDFSKGYDANPLAKEGRSPSTREEKDWFCKRVAILVREGKTRDEAIALAREEFSKGGPGSGNHGHSGRPGQIGGSGPGSGGIASAGKGPWEKHPDMRDPGKGGKTYYNVRSRIGEVKDEYGKRYEYTVEWSYDRANTSPQSLVGEALTRAGALKGIKDAIRDLKPISANEAKLPAASGKPKDPEKPIFRPPPGYRQVIDHD